MVDIKRVAFDIEKSKDDHNYDLQLVGARGPRGALSVIGTYSMAASGPTAVDQAIAGSYDLVGIRLKRSTETKKADQRRYTVKNIRVGALALTDTYDLSDGFTEIFTRLGDTPHVFNWGRNEDSETVPADMLPFDVARASIGEIADELAIIGPWFWRREYNEAEARHGYAGEFGTRRWKVIDPHTPIKLLPVEQFNAVTYEYNFGAGYTFQRTVVASPNTFEPGVVKAFNLDWEDPPRETVAAIFAQQVANYLATERTSGRGIIHKVAEVYPDLVLGDGTTGYWRLGESSGTLAEDASPSALDGTYMATGGPPSVEDESWGDDWGDIPWGGGGGSPGGIDVGGRSAPSLLTWDNDTSYELDGTTWVEVAHDALLVPGTGDFSLELWLRRAANPSAIEFLLNKGFGGTTGYEIRLMTNGTLSSRVGSTNVTSGAVMVTDNVPHHVVFSFARSGMGSCYVDGALAAETSIASQSGTNLSAPGFLNLGRSSLDASYFLGGLDEVAYYPTALTDVQALAHYNAGVGNATKFPGEILPGDNLILPRHGHAEVTVGEMSHAEDGKLLDIEFTSGNPLLDKWLEHRTRHLNQGFSNEASTLGALDVQEPKAPVNLELGFRLTETRKGIKSYAAHVTWNEVTEDVDGNGTVAEVYHAKVRPYLDAAGTNPVADNKGGGWREKTLRAKKSEDDTLDPALNTPTLAIFKFLDKPKDYYWKAMVRAEDFLGQLSAWAGPTPGAKPAMFKPPAPTAVDVDVLQHHVQVDWEAADLETAEDDLAPALDTTIAYFKVKILKNGSLHGKVHRVDGTKLTIKAKKTEDQNWTAQVASVDAYGNMSAWVSSVNRTGKRPPQPENAPGLTIDNNGDGNADDRAIVNFSYNQAGYDEDNINFFTVQLQGNGNNSFPPNPGNNGQIRRVDDEDESVCTFPRVDVNRVYRARFRAVDRDGRKSPWSAWSVHKP